MDSSDTILSVRTGKRRSLRWRLLVPLNAAVVLIVGAFLAWDCLSAWQTLLEEKRAALQEEAEILLPAAVLLRNKPEALQGYIDEVCGKAQAAAPGHHVAVDVEGKVLQARSNHRDPEGMFRSMAQGSRSPDGMAMAEDGRVVVGSAAREGVAAYVSEHLDDIMQVLWRVILRRVASVLVVAAGLAVVVSFLVARLVDRPLRDVVESVRRVKAGELGSQAPSSTTEEIGFLADEFNTMSTALADADRERREQMQKARRIQDHLQPGPEAMTWLPLAHAYVPANEVGGDYFDVYRRAGGEVLLCIADVTGHGVPAAMGAAVLKNIFVSAADQTAEPDQVLAAVGDGFSDVLLEEDFASMMVITVDRAAGKLRYASAGHPPAYLIRPEEPIRRLLATGPPLGIPLQTTWETVTLDIRPGDRLVMVTDGLMEQAGASGGYFGEKRLEATIEAHRAERLDLLCESVIQRVREFRGAAAQNDDMTMLAAEL